MGERGATGWSETERLRLFSEAALSGQWTLGHVEGAEEAPTTLVFARTGEARSLLLGLAHLVEAADSSGWLLRDLKITTAASSLVQVSARFQPSLPLLMARRAATSSAKRRAAGHRLGRPPLIPDAVDRRIAEEVAAGRKYGAIARMLNDEGVPTSRGGSKWWPTTVHTAYQRALRTHSSSS